MPTPNSLTPEIVETTAQPTAVIRLIVPRDEIRSVMGPAMEEVSRAVAGQGLQPTGPMFALHFRIDPDVFDFEVGLPLNVAVTPVGRVQASELPATKIARTVYRGPYEGLGAAWGEFHDLIEEQGLTPAGSLWESYTAFPEGDADPVTELNCPLAANAG
jgi:effector-binding domain-containing protein